MLLLVLSMTACTVFSQRASSFRADLGLVWNHQGFFKLFDGVAEAGIGFNMQVAGNLAAGASMRLGILSRSGTTNRLAVYRPGVNLHYRIPLSGRLAIVPQASIGYAFLGISNGEFSYRETRSGWNPGAELRILWTRQSPLDFYLFGRFDAVFLDEDPDFTRLEYYRRVLMTAVGIGINIKSRTQ